MYLKINPTYIQLVKILIFGVKKYLIKFFKQIKFLIKLL